METTFIITAHVAGKTISISCGEGLQRMKWIGHVAIARWDEETHQGWRRLGAPVEIQTDAGAEIEQGAIIRDVLSNGDHIKIITSLDPDNTT